MSNGKRAVKAKVAISKNKERHWFLIPFGAVFVVGGLVMFYFLTLVPMLNWYQAQRWEAVPCIIKSSEVRRHESSDGTTYSVAISYSYTYNGVAYTSDRYDFSVGSSSGRSAKQAIVNAHPPGSERTCFVNPADPSSAVISREFSYFYLLGVAGLAALVIGLFVAHYGYSKMKAPPSPHVTGEAYGSAHSPLPLKLKPSASSLNRFVSALFIALFWNGITWTMVFFIVTDGPGGAATIGIAAFMSIFVIIGLFLLGLVFKQLLNLFNPSPELTLTPGGLQLGAEARIDWHFTGATGRIARMRIWVEGQESATYRRGTKTVTDRSVFEKYLVLDSENPQDMAHGRVQFAMPEYTMHTFEASNNKIEWTIKVHGDIKRWPDIDYDFPVNVLPLAPHD